MARTTLKHVSGVNEFKRKLADLEKKTRNKIVAKAMRAGAKVIQKQAKANAPVKTGFLRSQIKVRAGKRRKGKIYFVVTMGKKNFTGKGFYGAIQEFGSLNTGRASQSARASRRASERPHVKIEGKHFMGHAFDQQQAEAAALILDGIKRGIEAEGSR